MESTSSQDERNLKRSLKTGSIKKLVNEYLAKAIKIKTKEGFDKLWKKEIEILKSNPYNYSSNTIKTYCSSYYRPALIKLYNPKFSDYSHKYLKIRESKVRSLSKKLFLFAFFSVKLPHQEKSVLDDNYAIKLHERSRKPQKIKNIKEMIELSVRNLSPATNYLDTVFAICFLTGRRPIEVLKIASFKPVSKYEIEFSGKAKTKSKEDKFEKHIIPCLANSTIIVKALNNLRVLLNFKDKTNKQVHDKVSSAMHKRINKVYDFGFVCDCKKCTEKKNTKKLKEVFKMTLELKTVACYKLKPYSLRYAYARTCEAVFNKNESNSIYYIGSVLRHKGHNMNSGHSYQDFIISNEEKERLKNYFNQ